MGENDAFNLRNTDLQYVVRSAGFGVHVIHLALSTVSLRSRGPSIGRWPTGRTDTHRCQSQSYRIGCDVHVWKLWKWWEAHGMLRARAKDRAWGYTQLGRWQEVVTPVKGADEHTQEGNCSNTASCMPRQMGFWEGKRGYESLQLNRDQEHETE